MCEVVQLHTGVSDTEVANSRQTRGRPPIGAEPATVPPLADVPPPPAAAADDVEFVFALTELPVLQAYLAAAR